MAPSFRVIDHYASHTLNIKIESIINEWDRHKLNLPQSNMAATEMVLLFSLPDKMNIVLGKLIYDAELLTLLKNELTDICNILEQHYPGCEPKRICLNLMKAHGVIPEHTDFMYHYDHTTRVHLPIVTDEKVVFTFPDGDLHMFEGEIVEFNNSVPHSGVNDSDNDRYHLIIDMGRKDDPYWGTENTDWKGYVK